MAISRANCWSFITELVTRNPTGIPALEDGLFANLLIRLVVLYFLFGKGKGKGRERSSGLFWEHFKSINGVTIVLEIVF